MARQKKFYERSVFNGLNFTSPKYCGGDKGETFFTEACDMNNVRVGIDNGLYVRKGRAKVGNITAGDVGHTIGYFKDVAGSEFGIIVGTQDIYTDAGFGGSPSVSKTLTSPVTYAVHADYNEHLFYCDQVNENLKFDGTTWNRLGIAAPAAAPTVAGVVVAGNLNGVYSYYYVYVYKNAGIGYETTSRWCPFSAEVTTDGVTTGKINVTVVVPTDPQVTHIRIYRISSTAAQYQLVIERTKAQVIASPTYLDNIADAVLGAPQENPNEGEPLDITGTPVKFKGMVVWKSRLFGWDDDYIYPSVLGHPERFYNDSSDVMKPIAVNSHDKTGVIGAIPYRNNIVFMTKNRRLILTGDTEPFSMIEYDDGIGTIAPRSLAIVRGMLFWLSYEGVYAWDGVNDPVMISYPINKDFSGNSRGLLDSGVSFLAGAKGIYVPEEDCYWLSVPFSAAGFNSRTFVLDVALFKKLGIRLSSWLYWGDISFSDAVVTPDRQLYTLKPQSNDYINEVVGNQNEGVDIANAFYETRHWDFGTKNYDKVFYYGGFGAYTTGLPVQMDTIFDLGVITSNLNQSVSGSTWDVDKWDEGIWGGSVLGFVSDRYEQTAMGTIVGFKITMDKDATFDGFAVEYRLRRRNV